VRNASSRLREAGQEAARCLDGLTGGPHRVLVLHSDTLAGDQQEVWTITAGPHEENGLAHVIMRWGDLVRRMNERFADDYVLVEDAQ
jgi:hypothetical protein